MSACVKCEYVVCVELPFSARVPECRPQVLNQPTVQALSLSTVVVWIRKPVLNEVTDAPSLGVYPRSQRYVDRWRFEVVREIPFPLTRDALPNLPNLRRKFGRNNSREPVQQSPDALFDAAHEPSVHD